VSAPSRQVSTAEADTAKADTAKVCRVGTHRVRHPEQTWESIADTLPRFGITRVADVTRLDVLGLPVMIAVRPLAKTLSVSQGKGQTPLLAKVSAVMEAIELWHAEYAPPPVVHRLARADELDLPYRVTDLPAVPGSLISTATRFDWVSARGLCSGRATLVPVDAAVLTAPHQHVWPPQGILRSSDGLASGNSWAEAVLHGLYEIIERDTISRRRTWPASAPVDPFSVDDPDCAGLIERMRAAGVRLEIEHLPNRFGVACFAAAIWSADFAVRSLGSGAHLAPEIALSRALTEAAQSRLTAIVGTRDDLPAIYQQVRHGGQPPPAPSADRVPWAECVAQAASFDDLGEELAYVGATVRTVIGVEPLVVDFATGHAFSTVKVVAPGTSLEFEQHT
jgi:ribosomal protein S12 methylthiotransferase accessory factor